VKTWLISRSETSVLCGCCKLWKALRELSLWMAFGCASELQFSVGCGVNKGELPPRRAAPGRARRARPRCGGVWLERRWTLHNTQHVGTYSAQQIPRLLYAHESTWLDHVALPRFNVQYRYRTSVNRPPAERSSADLNTVGNIGCSVVVANTIAMIWICLHGP